VDITLNARLPNSLNLQAGTSTGRGVSDNCATQVLIDSPDPRNCHNAQPFQTTLRGSVAYTIPKIDVLVAGTLRSQPGIEFSTNLTATGAPGNGAQWQVPNTVVQSILGHLPPGALIGGTTLVPLIDTEHRLYGPRRSQLDMRVAKILRYRHTR